MRPVHSSNPADLRVAARAWSRSVQFFAEAFLELLGLIWLLCVFALVFVGVGIWLLPGAIEFAGANADRSRALALRLTGVTVEAYRRSVSGNPGIGQARHTWQRLKDPAVRRDLLWNLLNPIVGMPLGVLSLGLVLAGTWELISMPFQIFLSQFQPATWLTTAEEIGLPLALGIAAALGTIAVQILVGIVIARPLLRTQGEWARLVLHIEDTEQSPGRRHRP
jgi:Putative sensor